MTFVRKFSKIDQMSEDLIPQSVCLFIEKNIDSIAELEALLLIQRDPRKDWAPELLAERLYISLEKTEEAMSRLHSIGLIGVKKGNPVTYRYEPSSPELEQVVGEIVDAYSKYLIPVTNLIHSKPQSRVQQFADAFRLRKKEDK
jgi:hypothetical protein